MEDKKELCDLKVKIMLQRIDKLCNIYRSLQKTECKEMEALEVIKRQYLRMYSKLIETEEYEKYKEIEDMVIKKLAEIELKLDETLYSMIQNYQEMLINSMQSIKKSENYQNFQNMEEELNKIETLKKLLKLYSPYMSESEKITMVQQISELKFDVLFRKQVEELIYQNGNMSNNLEQYDSEEEKEIFKKHLEEKVNAIRPIFTNYYEESTELIFEATTEQILSDRALLERLIIIDMKKNTHYYINLLKAKIFNAHLCNIANNPFKNEVYLTKEQLHQLGYTKYDRGLATNKVNYSLLVAILKSVITDEDVNIIECENLYRKFGFECRPISMNIGQECVSMIFAEVKKGQEFTTFLQQFQERKKTQEGQYCKIELRPLKYEFDEEERDSENLLNQILEEREEIERKPEIKARNLFLKKQEVPRQIIIKSKDSLKEKEKIKEEGRITTSIPMIIALIEDIIDKYHTEMQKLKQKLDNDSQRGEEGRDICIKLHIEEYEEEIQEQKNSLEWLKELKNRNEKLTLEEKRRLLKMINDVYKKMDIRYHVRKLLPLEDMGGERVRLAPIPEVRETYQNIETRSSFSGRISIYSLL